MFYAYWSRWLKERCNYSKTPLERTFRDRPKTSVISKVCYIQIATYGFRQVVLTVCLARFHVEQTANSVFACSLSFIMATLVSKSSADLLCFFRHDYNNTKLKLESTVTTLSASDWLTGCTPGVLLEWCWDKIRLSALSVNFHGCRRQRRTTNFKLINTQTIVIVASRYSVYSRDAVSFNNQQQLLGIHGPAAVISLYSVYVHDRRWMPAAGVGGVKTALTVNGTPACEAEAGLSSHTSPSPLAASTQSDLMLLKLHNALHLANRRSTSN